MSLLNLEPFLYVVCSPEAPSSEEEEVCLLMQECLTMRAKYVFRENEHPWEKEQITDPSTPKPNPQPFHYDPEPSSMVRVLFQIVVTSN